MVRASAYGVTNPREAVRISVRKIKWNSDLQENNICCWLGNKRNGEKVTEGDLGNDSKWYIHVYLKKRCAPGALQCRGYEEWLTVERFCLRFWVVRRKLCRRTFAVMYMITSVTHAVPSTWLHDSMMPFSDSFSISSIPSLRAPVAYIRFSLTCCLPFLSCFSRHTCKCTYSPLHYWYLGMNNIIRIRRQVVFTLICHLDNPAFRWIVFYHC